MYNPTSLALRVVSAIGALAGSASVAIAQVGQLPPIGREIAVATHLQDGEEYVVSLRRLLRHGGSLFSANWTAQEGAGRPLTKGNGAPIADPTSSLVFPRAFNRISANDANSCAGCHNAPFGIAGGGGDFVTGVFVLGQRFDFATFDQGDPMPMRGTIQENGQPATMQSVANYRATLSMMGSGYIELLAREITSDLRSIRDTTPVGGSRQLVSKGISFGTVARHADGTWDTTQVVGLPAPSLATTGAASPPNVIIRPFHQAGAVVSLRQFSNNAFLTRKLWGCANEPPYFHHGQFTTLRQAVLAHDGEALASRQAFEGLPSSDRDSIIECLKSLQVLPPGTNHLVVDEDGKPRQWQSSF